MSHGCNGFIVASDSCIVDIKNIRRAMQPVTLMTKPKILIVESCRGSGFHPLQTALAFDGGMLSDLHRRSVTLKEDFEDADFVQFFSSVEGFYSVRNTARGSWFVQEIIKQISARHKKNDLLQIFTAVINEVSKIRVVSRFENSDEDVLMVQGWRLLLSRSKTSMAGRTAGRRGLPRNPDRNQQCRHQALCNKLEEREAKPRKLALLKKQERP